MIRAHRLSSLLLALLMLLCVLPLSACHGSRGRAAFTVPESFDRSRQYEITFWAKNDTNKVQTAIYQKAISDFQALYPNITVNMRLYTDYGRIYNDVITNIATNTTPNVCITYPDHIATYMTGSDVVVPLDDLFADARYGLGGSELLFDSPKLPVYFSMPRLPSSRWIKLNVSSLRSSGLHHKLPKRSISLAERAIA